MLALDDEYVLVVHKQIINVAEPGLWIRFSLQSDPFF